MAIDRAGLNFQMATIMVILVSGVVLAATSQSAPVHIEYAMPAANATEAAADDTPEFILYENFDHTLSSLWAVTCPSGPTWGLQSWSYNDGYRAMWCQAGGINGLPAPGFYRPNQDVELRWGPFSLLGASAANLAFSTRTILASGDVFSYGGSTSPSYHNGPSVTTTASGDWHSASVSLSSLCGKSTVYIWFRFTSDSSPMSVTEGVYVDTVRLTKTTPPPPPTLQWVGKHAWVTDGVKPDSGGPDSTVFVFKVKYTDPSGASPSLKRLVLARREGKKWRDYQNLAMAKESGTLATGAIYSCTMQLGNESLRYYFKFKGADGALVAGEPANWTLGPGIVGPPKLWWEGSAGYVTDGVHPDTGPPGTHMKFRVYYTDSEGDVPTTCQVRVRRDGQQIGLKTMKPWTSGDYRTGKTYQTWLAFGKPGVLEYRFEFADDDGDATGTPTEWQTGPILTSSGDPMVSLLTAMPTSAGAQVTFSLAGAADVSATVLNIAGRPVRTLCADQACEAGMNTLVWNALSDRGLRVPSGTYLIRITARAGDGAQSSALATVAVR